VRPRQDGVIKGEWDMRVSRWQPFNPLFGHVQQLQNEMNRLFDRWGGSGNPLDAVTVFPPVNVWEDGEQVHVEAELPGLELKDLEIYVTGGDQLVLKGERKTPQVEKAAWHRRERLFGAFHRTLGLPFRVDADRVEARFENGVLVITLAKHESARPRKIQVKGE
jgi:HSP20 family protein